MWPIAVENSPFHGDRMGHLPLRCVYGVEGVVEDTFHGWQIRHRVCFDGLDLQRGQMTTTYRSENMHTCTSD